MLLGEFRTRRAHRQRKGHDFREERHPGKLRARRTDIRRVRLPGRVCGVHDEELLLPEEGPHPQPQREGLQVGERTSRPRKGQPERSAAVPSDTSRRRGHRSRDKPRQLLRREHSVFRERAEHPRRRHAPRRLQGGRRQDPEGILQEELRTRRLPPGHSRCDKHPDTGAQLRGSDQDQARLQLHVGNCTPR